MSCFDDIFAEYLYVYADECQYVSNFCLNLINFSIYNREAEEAEQQRLLEEELIREKEAKKEGMRKRKPAFKATEKTDEELKGYSKLNMELTKGTGVKAVETKVY